MCLTPYKKQLEDIVPGSKVMIFGLKAILGASKRLLMKIWAVKIYFLRTVMCYKAHILQDSSPYIGEPLCKVWSPKSLWFWRYSLLRTSGVQAPQPPPHTPLQNRSTPKKLITQDCDGLLIPYFITCITYHKATFLPHLRSKLPMVHKNTPSFCAFESKNLQVTSNDENLAWQ